MNTPDGFTKADDEAIHDAMAEGAWALVLNADDSKRTAYLVELLQDDSVQAALLNFKCFMITADSEAASNLEIHDPASLTVLVESDTPEFSFKLEYPNETDADDLIQFLEETSLAIEAVEERRDFDD